MATRKWLLIDGNRYVRIEKSDVPFPFPSLLGKVGVIELPLKRGELCVMVTVAGGSYPIWKHELHQPTLAEVTLARMRGDL